MVLATPGSVNLTKLLNVDLHMLKSAYKPIKNRQRVKLYLGTSVTNALMVTMNANDGWICITHCFWGKITIDGITSIGCKLLKKS